MEIASRLHAGVATGVAVVGISAMVVAPLTPATQYQSLPTVAQDVRLAATTVPPGGILTSFLGNQVTYCSIICPLIVQTALTPLVTTLQTPGTFLAALQAGDLLKAIGAAAASVTGPTNAAAAAAILADGSIPAPRTLNELEVAVVGLLNVIPAAAGGLPGIIAALETARQDTFDALTSPIVPNQPSTVMPHGVVPVVVVSALNVVGAVIFPAFNHILSGAFQVPDAVAQELAATGDPVRALAAGINAATAAVTAAGADITNAIAKAVSDIRAATGQSVTANGTVSTNQAAPTQNSATATTAAHTVLAAPRALAATAAKGDTSRPAAATSAKGDTSRPAAATSAKGDTSRPAAATSVKGDDDAGTSHTSATAGEDGSGTSHPTAPTSATHDDAPGTSHPSSATPAKHDGAPGTSHPSSATPAKHDAGASASHSSHEGGKK